MALVAKNLKVTQLAKKASTEPAVVTRAAPSTAEKAEKAEKERRTATDQVLLSALSSTRSCFSVAR